MSPGARRRFADKPTAWPCSFRRRVCVVPPGDTNGIGLCFKNRRQFKEAQSYFTQAIEANPKKADYYVERCFANMMLNDLKAGTDDCTRAIEIDSDSKYAYPDRARAYQHLGKNELARKDFAIAESLD